MKKILFKQIFLIALSVCGFCHAQESYMSDFYKGNLEVLDKMDEVFKQAGGVIFAGDFAKFGNEETGLPALEKLCSRHDTIFSVIGNCDNPSFIEEIEKRDISVEKQLVMYEGLAFAGSGGGSKFTGTTPNEKSEEELMADFKIITEQKYICLCQLNLFLTLL